MQRQQPQHNPEAQGNDAQEPAPAAIQPDHGLKLSGQAELAFSKCTECVKKGHNSYRVRCGICNWVGTTNDSKMLYRHYLRVMNCDGKVCIPVEDLEAEHNQFIQDIRHAWAKKQKSSGRSRSLSPVLPPRPPPTMNTSADQPSPKRMVTRDIRDQVQQRVVTEASCRAAWDKVFFKCVSFKLANDPDFRDALRQTSYCPGFKLNCTKVTQLGSRMLALIACRRLSALSASTQ